MNDDDQNHKVKRCPLCLQPANGHSDCLDYVDDLLERASEHCQVCKEVRDILFAHAKRRHDQLMSLARKPIKRVSIHESYYPLPGFKLSSDGKYYEKDNKKERKDNKEVFEGGEEWESKGE